MPNLGKNKCQEIVLKSIVYFNHQNIHIVDNAVLQKIIKQRLSKVNVQTYPLDVLFLEDPDWAAIDNLIGNQNFHNDSIIFVNNIHTNIKNERLWALLIKKQVFPVSVDLFHCGVLFFRREQAKEHFTIRI